jgi:DNA polymerase/3'-5' exonuclease PolX
MSNIRDIYGIGDKKANELKKHYNIRTVSSLRNYVRKIPNIITDSQRKGLKYHSRIKHKVPYKTVEKHANYILKQLPGSVIAGSFRRKERKIGDIDVLITSDLDKAVEKLIHKKYIVASLSKGDEKFSGVVKLPNVESYRKIDIVKTTKEEKPFALLYFTGDFVQNISMRQKAKKKGFTLSQHGLRNNSNNRLVKNIKSERDIFNFLNIEYLIPENRIH